mmetsp:Transcript_20835/g.65214  ORF Transcript_20835/g.65214 Transcript_20835/m.65214 type:complete len:355 (+) Transcript_20835:844-1908(+)
MVDPLLRAGPPRHPRRRGGADRPRPVRDGVRLDRRRAGRLRRRQADLRRVAVGGRARDARRRREPHPGCAGARRKGPVRCLRRRERGRARPHRAGGLPRRLPKHGPELRRPRAVLRRGRRVRGLLLARRRNRVTPQVRPAARRRRGRLRGNHHGQEADGALPGARRRRGVQGRAAAGRRVHALRRRPARGGLLLPPDSARRRAGERRHPADGDLRPDHVRGARGRLRRRRRQRRRGRPARQQLRLCALELRVCAVGAARARRRGSARGGHVRLQRPRGLHLPLAVPPLRRPQAERLRPLRRHRGLARPHHAAGRVRRRARVVAFWVGRAAPHCHPAAAAVPLARRRLRLRLGAD